MKNYEISRFIVLPNTQVPGGNLKIGAFDLSPRAHGLHEALNYEDYGDSIHNPDLLLKLLRHAPAGVMSIAVLVCESGQEFVYENDSGYPRVFNARTSQCNFKWDKSDWHLISKTPTEPYVRAYIPNRGAYACTNYLVDVALSFSPGAVWCSTASETLEFKELFFYGKDFDPHFLSHHVPA